MLSLLIMMMASIEPEVSDFWMNPDEGANFDDEEYLLSKDIDDLIILKGRNYFDEIINSYDYNFCLQKYFPKMKQFLEGNDWRWRSSALMAASQFSELAY